MYKAAAMEAVDAVAEEVVAELISPGKQKNLRIIYLIMKRGHWQI